MLIISASTYFISWAPLNALNFIINVFDSAEKPLFSQEDHFLCIYAVCHLVGMSSACVNPFLYGFMNENFQGEFVKVLECWVGLCNKFAVLCAKRRGPSPVLADCVAEPEAKLKAKIPSLRSKMAIAQSHSDQMVVKSISEKPSVQEAVDIAFITDKHNQIRFNDRGRDAIFV